MILVANINAYGHSLQTYRTSHDNQLESTRLMVDPRNTPDMINKAKDAVDSYIALREAQKLANIADKLKGFKQLSACLGIAGALVGFIFSFFGTGPDPEILKLQQMIRETQTLITLGNEEILNAIRKLNSQEAQRSAMDSMGILDVLVTKHMIQNLEYDVGSYDVLPCGPSMTLCNNAFIDLARKMDDILSASFDESPRGDK